MSFEPAWSREVDLLLACARAWRDPGSVEAGGPSALAALTGRGVDWSALLRLSDRHGITPLVHRAVERRAVEGVPLAAARELRARFDANALNSLRLAAHLQALLARLDGAGIPAIPYKGPAVAVAAYGSLVLRMFGDLDILVSEEHLSGAIAVVRSAGYRPQTPLTAAQEGMLARAGRPAGFVDPSGAVAVELHATLTPRYLAARVDHRQLAEEVETLALGESRIRTLAPAALLLALCLHGTKHLWTRLVWVCDVAEAIRARPDLDWARLVARARAWGVERMLRLGILVAVDLVEARPPQEIRQWAAADRVARSLAADVRGRLEDPNGQEPGLFAQTRFHLRALQHWRDRLQYARFAARPSEADWASRPLPAPLRVLHYPLRAVRLLARGPGLPPHRD